jgi:UDP-N-acetylmuramate dehydrogenase
MITVRQHISLKPFNTFGLDVKAENFTEVASVEEIQTLLNEPFWREQELLILGGGSNVLFTKDVQGVVMLNRIGGIGIVREDEAAVWVKAGAGVVWHELVMWCIERGWGGIENLSLIPGSVGAGPMQNIGAYGVELKDVFYELEAMKLDDLTVHTFSNAACRFGYRESVFKRELRNKFFIISVTFKLSKSAQLNTSYGAISTELQRMGVQEPGIRDVSNAVINIRRSKLPDPTLLGNAGSFFKNPEVDEQVFSALKAAYPNVVGYPTSPGRVKLAAGWLIEQCGWKGRVVGHTGSHKDQALVLVNYGGATGKEIWQLALDIKSSVLEKFGVNIEPEVNVY